jgi:probable rRNA maturation factor
MALAISITDARGRALRVRGLAAWLRRIAPRAARGRLSIALVSDGQMRALNKRFRGSDYPTDVLSFPALARPRASARARISEPPAISHERLLGDVVIARGVACRQAREAGHSETAELKVLALHGLLHLLGYDHERDGGNMRRVERRLRRKGGLREGLIERS